MRQLHKNAIDYLQAAYKDCPSNHRCDGYTKETLEECLKRIGEYDPNDLSSIYPSIHALCITMEQQGSGYPSLNNFLYKLRHEFERLYSHIHVLPSLVQLQKIYLLSCAKEKKRKPRKEPIDLYLVNTWNRHKKQIGDFTEEEIDYIPSPYSPEGLKHYPFLKPILHLEELEELREDILKKSDKYEIENVYALVQMLDVEPFTDLNPRMRGRIIRMAEKCDKATRILNTKIGMQMQHKHYLLHRAIRSLLKDYSYSYLWEHYPLIVEICSLLDIYCPYTYQARVREINSSQNLLKIECSETNFDVMKYLLKEEY